jgi:hypothetical protein
VCTGGPAGIPEKNPLTPERGWLTCEPIVDSG